MTHLAKTQNQRKCNPTTKGAKSARFGLFLALSFAALILAEATLTLPDLTTWFKVALAFAHVPFTILAAVLGWRFLKGVDELQRLIHMQAFIIGITGSGAILLSYSLLTFAGLVSGEMTWMVWSLLWIFYSIGYRVVSKKY